MGGRPKRRLWNAVPTGIVPQTQGAIGGTYGKLNAFHKTNEGQVKCGIENNKSPRFGRCHGNAIFHRGHIHNLWLCSARSKTRQQGRGMRDKPPDVMLAHRPTLSRRTKHTVPLLHRRDINVDVRNRAFPTDTYRSPMAGTPASSFRRVKHTMGAWYTPVSPCCWNEAHWQKKGQRDSSSKRAEARKHLLG